MPPTTTHEVIAPKAIAAPAANYAHARLTTSPSRWLHTSGVVPIAPDGRVPPRLADQARVIWTSLLAMLHEAEMTSADVVSVTTYVVAGHDLGPIMSIRDDILDDNLAASTLVVVPQLARPEWSMEISIIAAA